MRKSRKGSKEIKVFIDSSVIIAAILSPPGGSFRLIRDSLFENYTLLVSGYILEECMRILNTKFLDKVHILPTMLDSYRFKIVQDLSEREVEKVIEIINFKDAPILAGAIKYKADYLITLDKKDFLSKKVLSFVKQHNLSIFTPKEFLQK